MLVEEEAMTAESTKIWRCPSCNRLLIEKGVDYAKARHAGKGGRGGGVGMVCRRGKAGEKFGELRVGGKKKLRNDRLCERWGVRLLLLIGVLAVLPWCRSRGACGRSAGAQVGGGQGGA